MRAADRDGDPVVFHDLPEQVCACHEGDLQLLRRGELGIVVRDRCSVHDEVDGSADAAGHLRIADLCPHGDEMLREG